MNPIHHRINDSTILIVDDDPMGRRALRRWLQREEWDVQEVDCGRAALAAAAQLNPDLVLLDLMLPDIHGHEVCQRLRSDPRAWPSWAGWSGKLLREASS